MQVQPLLLKTLEKLRKDDFEKFQWYLSMEVLAGCEPISECVLENASRTFTVRRMIEDYGEESAVKVTVKILEEIGHKNTAESLKKTYADGKTAAPSTSSSAVTPPAAPVAPPAAPATMLAQQGSAIIAPTITGGSYGSLNIIYNSPNPGNTSRPG